MLQADLIDLPSESRDALRRYVHLVQQTCGSSVVTLAAYGPVLWDDGEMRAVDSVLILSGDDLGLVRKLAAHAPTMQRLGIAAPLIMPADSLTAARDSFPLELLDIQQCHVPLLGEDCFATMVFDREHVRLQCERELRTLAIALRQRVLIAGDRAAPPTSDLLIDVVRAVRGLIWLRRVDRRTGPDVLAAAAETCGRELPGIARIAAGEHGWDAYEALYRDVVTLGLVCDAL